MLTIGAHLIRLDYILSEIRFKGNAYGARFTYSPYDAVLSQSSYRDPHVARTINVFEQTVDYVKAVEWTQTDIDRAIIATAKDGEETDSPKPSFKATPLSQHLVGQTREMREEHLRTTPSGNAC